MFRLPRLPPSVPRSGVSEVARRALQQLLGDVDRALAVGFRDGHAVEDLIRARSAAVDSVLVHVWSACVGEANGIALFAVGGFGRGELFPQSDVDVLALCEVVPHAAVARALESFFVCLWDLGLKPGHSVRTLVECRALSAQDATIYTSLLDARRIAGDIALEAPLAALTSAADLWPPAAYLAEKNDDRRRRHARFGDTAYNLEPDVKNGPGTLRDINLMLWLGQRVFAAPTLQALVTRKLITRREADIAQESSQWLMRTRFALHLLAGRPEERLLFDYQRALALQFGYVDEHRENLGVEQFMQRYYRAVIALERLCDQFLHRCEESLDTESGNKIERLTLDFISVDGRLDCAPPDLLMQRPAALIDLFRVWIENAELKGLRADFVRRVHEALEFHGARLAADTEVNASFVRLLRKGAPAVEALLRMNRHGVLARYLPAFGRVVGRMQYDLFHAYTVDEHSMRVLRIVARFAGAETSAEFALAHDLFARLPKPELLLLAALFHDIAKGRGGDHSTLGEAEAVAFCGQLQLTSAETELVAWLVRWHLLMSVTAQRQDITDQDVVHRFAVSVAEWERLDYLYLLTVADIAGTSVKLWNSWKDRLLADLYTSARYVLRAGLDRPPHVSERIAECRQLALSLLQVDGISASAATALWKNFPDEYFLRFEPQRIVWQTAGILRTREPPLVLIDTDERSGATVLFVYAEGRDGLFATITAVLDRMRVSVQDARIVTTRAEMSLDTFVVLDHDAKPLRDASQIARLQSALIQALQQKPYIARLSAHRVVRRLRHFPIQPRIEFSRDAISGRSQLALVCADRPGLLAGVASIFREHRVRVHDARIATFGERVEDFFLISDESDAVLGNAAQSALQQALIRDIESHSHAPKERHVSA